MRLSEGTNSVRVMVARLYITGRSWASFGGAFRVAGTLARLRRSLGVSVLLFAFAPFATGVQAAGAVQERIDRNFVPSATAGTTVPAVPASALKVFAGRLTVRIKQRNYDLETLTAMPPGSGPFPLAVVSHGVPRSSKHRKNTRLRHLLPVAEDFARRGYKAVVFARRGYASSSGRYRDSYGSCSKASRSSYVRAARNGARDYDAVITVLARGPDVDASTVIAVGQSGGGFAVSALASRPPEGLAAVISFAGGRGSQSDLANCNEAGFVKAFESFGKKARVPALWLYSIADRFFWPELVDRALDAYAKNGAPVRLERVGRLWFIDDGHKLVRLGGRELWRPRIDAFLHAIGAPSWETSPGSGAVARLPAPTSLNARGQGRWRRYLGEAPHKAFAQGPGTRFGWASARTSAAKAVEAAMGYCEAKGQRCRIVSVDGLPR